MVISPILSDIAAELAVEESLLGTLVTAYSAALAIFAIISGPISDKIGRRRILLLGSGVMTIALALHSFVSSFETFLGVRVLAGVAGGVLSGSAVSYIGDYFPYNRRGWATGWVMSGTAAGQIVGIPIGKVLAGTMGFRAPFQLFAVTMAATFLLVWAKVPQPDVRRTEGRLTIRRAVTDYWAMIRRPEIASAAVAFLLMFLGIALYVIYLPLWLETEMGATTWHIAAIFAVGGVGNVLMGPQAGKLSDRIGRKGIILVSCVGLSLVMLVTVPVMRSLWVAYPLFFVIMLLVAMRMSPFSALLTALVPDERRGSLLSMTVALGQLGLAMGAAMAGPLFTGLGFWSNSVGGAVAVLGMGLMVWFLVPEPALEAPAEAKRMEEAAVEEAG